jgi:hypothetical protein
MLVAVPMAPIPVLAQSKAWVCGRSLAGILLSGRDLCDGLITCAEEFYRVWFCLSDCEASIVRMSCRATKKRTVQITYWTFESFY